MMELVARLGPGPVLLERHPVDSSGPNTEKIGRTTGKIWCEIDAILYLGRSHEMLLQVWDAFEKQRIVSEGDVIKEH